MNILHEHALHLLPYALHGKAVVFRQAGMDCGRQIPFYFPLTASLHCSFQLIIDSLRNVKMVFLIPYQPVSLHHG